MNPFPKISVLMLVYNGERYLREAIDNILRQPLTDFELITISDGSTEGSIVLSYSDARVRLLDNLLNVGLNKSFNIGIG